jgi:hypothetical protein
MNARFLLAPLVLVLLPLAAQADDFIFSPAYVLPEGKSALLGVLTRSTDSERFVNPNGLTGKAETYNLTEYISARHSLTDADQIAFAVSYDSHNDRHVIYDYGNVVENHGERKAEPALSYMHRFGGRNDAFTAAGSVAIGQGAQGSGSEYVQPGLAAQCRLGEQLLLTGTTSIIMHSDNKYATTEHYQEGVEWQVLPWLELVPQLTQVHFNSTTGNSGTLQQQVSLAAHAQLNAASYITLEAGKSSEDDSTRGNWQYSNDTGRFTRIGIYVGI